MIRGFSRVFWVGLYMSMLGSYNKVTDLGSCSSLNKFFVFRLGPAHILCVIFRADPITSKSKQIKYSFTLTVATYKYMQFAYKRTMSWPHFYHKLEAALASLSYCFCLYTSTSHKNRIIFRKIKLLKKLTESPISLLRHEEEKEEEE